MIKTVEAILNDYGIDISRGNRNNYLIRCPYHDDSNPSLSIHKEHGAFLCFSCGESGGLSKFVSDWEEITKEEAEEKIYGHKSGLYIKPSQKKDYEFTNKIENVIEIFYLLSGNSEKCKLSYELFKTILSSKGLEILDSLRNKVLRSKSQFYVAQKIDEIKEKRNYDLFLQNCYEDKYLRHLVFTALTIFYDEGYQKYLKVTNDGLRVKILVKTRAFDKRDSNYWYKKYGVKKSNLIKYKVFPCKVVFIDDYIFFEDKGYNPVYAFDYGFGMYKIYQPNGDKFVKWRNNAGNMIIQGFDELEYKSPELIITKSLKDVIVLNSLGYESIAPSSESTFISDEILTVLKKKYKRIYLFYDNDKTGKEQTEKILKIHKIKNLSIPERYLVKDISDFREKYGEKKTKELLNGIIK